jgi:hypothetical protein
MTYDDVLFGYYRYEFDQNGLRLRKIYYNGPGSDMAWFTGDDRVATYYQYTRDSNYYVVREDWYTSPGDNGAWFQSINEPQVRFGFGREYECW